MNIQELGSIGEFVAAIATVATLAYLALQIRQNTRALRYSALQTHKQSIQQMIALIAASPENASVWQRGTQEFDALSPGEQAQFTAILLGTFNNSDSAYTNFVAGLIPEDAWRREWGVLRFYLQSNGGRHVWNIAKQLDSISPSFVDFAESELLARGGPHA